MRDAHGRPDPRRGRHCYRRRLVAGAFGAWARAGGACYEAGHQVDRSRSADSRDDGRASSAAEAATSCRSSVQKN